MATPDTWTLADARERVTTPAWLESHRLFAEGDHLQAGNRVGIPGAIAGVPAGWIAPMPPPGHALHRFYLDGIIRSFVSSNKVKEVQWRHTAGVVGRQPTRGFESRAPLVEGKEMTPELRRLKEQADAWMAARWEAEGMHGALQKAIAALLYAGRQPARMLLPRGYLTEGSDGTKRLPRAPLPDMLKMLRLTYPRPEECTVWTDPDTFEQIGIFTYKQNEEDRAEVTWVDRGSGLTHVRQIGASTGTVMETAYDFGGLIPMFEMQRDPLITTQIVQNQKALNLALSTVPRNVYTAGARARTLFNVDAPGKEIRDSDGNVTFEASAVDWGAGDMNIFQGSPIYGEDGKTVIGYANPSMQVEEPVDVAPSRAAVEVHEWQILSEARQLHALMSADAVASGISRIVARVEFMGSLSETKPTADACLEWQMDIRMAMAEAFSGGREGGRSPRPYSTYLRANAECKLDPGPITPEERIALDQMVQSGRLSDETALALMGVEDVAEEKARKTAENRTKNVFELIAKADEAGMDRFAVLTILGGMEPEEARALARGDVDAGGLTQ